MRFIKSNIKREKNTVASPTKIVRAVNDINSFQLDIWGQPFNGTSNISGDLQSVGNITMTGDISINNMKISSDGVQFGGLESYTFDGKIIAPSGKIDSISSSNANITNLSSTTGIINNISSNSISNTGQVITKDLTVTGQAHFFELIIDKVKSSGGAAIFSPADGFKVDIVEGFDQTGQLVDSNPYYYRLYWKTGDQIENLWRKKDQALCQTFNKNGQNKYYWAVVTDVGTVEREDGILEPETHNYNFIEIYAQQVYDNSGLPCIAGTVNPEIGDSIVMLGSRSKYPERQSALYISSYNSIDQGLNAPFIAQYKGISDFDLSSHRASWWSLTSNRFTGDFNVVTGGQTMSVQDYINQQITQSSVNLINYKAYAKSETGLDFTLNDKSGDDSYPFIGIAITSKTQSELTAADFVWMKKDTTSPVYRLIPLNEYAIVDMDRMIIINCQYKLLKIEGGTSTELDALPVGFTLDSNGGTPVMRDGIISLDNRINNDQINIWIRLFNNGLLIDERTIQVSMEAGVIFSITDELTATVTDNTGNIANLQVQADNINLSLKNLNDGLSNTGINIEKGKITLNADNTEITGNLNLRGTFTTGSDTFNCKLFAFTFDGYNYSGLQSNENKAGHLYFTERNGNLDGELELINSGGGQSVIRGGYIYTTGYLYGEKLYNTVLDGCTERVEYITDDTVLEKFITDTDQIGNITVVCKKDKKDPIKINLPSSVQLRNNTVITVITLDTSVMIAKFNSTDYTSWGQHNIIKCIWIDNQWHSWYVTQYKPIK